VTRTARPGGAPIVVKIAKERNNLTNCARCRARAVSAVVGKSQDTLITAGRSPPLSAVIGELQDTLITAGRSPLPRTRRSSTSASRTTRAVSAVVGESRGTLISKFCIWSNATALSDETTMCDGRVGDHARTKGRRDGREGDCARTSGIEMF